MNEEISAIERNRTQELVDLPEGKDAIGLKWVFRTKLNADGSVQKYKARFIAKGYAQLPGIDFSETFSSVARMETIRIILAIAAHYNWLVYQFDVKSAFLNDELLEDVYVKQPQGFMIKEKEYEVIEATRELLKFSSQLKVKAPSVDEAKEGVFIDHLGKTVEVRTQLTICSVIKEVY